MFSRLRENLDSAFDVFVEIANPEGADAPFILQKVPQNFEEQELLKSIIEFSFPCIVNSTAVEQFVFVLTDIDGKIRFGFCRHAAGSQTGLCILTSLPWFEVFNKLLNAVADMTNNSQQNHISLLETFYSDKSIVDSNVKSPGTSVDVVTASLKEKFSFVVPNVNDLPAIPENRSLTEYYNAMDFTNMVTIFVSMIFERRILFVSRKLGRLTACVLGASCLIYPLFWQHLYIPVLPNHLIDYCNAPMPFLIGIHSSQYEKATRDIGDAVIVDVDLNTVQTPHNDIALLPSDVVSSLKKNLKSLQEDRLKTSLLGDGVSRAFLRTLVSLIGSYRDALKYRPGEQITFDKSSFINSRSENLRPLLEKILSLQTFEVFIQERLEQLNSGEGFTGEFEQEANLWSDQSQSNYKEWVQQMKKQGKKLKKEGKEKLADFTSKVKTKGKKALVDIRYHIDTIGKEDTEPIKRSRPTTLPGAHLKPARPIRPPAFSKHEDEGGPLPMHQYQSSPKHYKVLDLENLSEQLVPSSDDSPSPFSPSTDLPRRLSSNMLMNDPDIKQVIQKSYSLEDLTLSDTAESSKQDTVKEAFQSSSSPYNKPPIPVKLHSLTTPSSSKASKVDFNLIECNIDGPPVPPKTYITSATNKSQPQPKPRNHRKITIPNDNGQNATSESKPDHPTRPTAISRSAAFYNNKRPMSMVNMPYLSKGVENTALPLSSAPPSGKTSTSSTQSKTNNMCLNPCLQEFDPLFAGSATTVSTEESVSNSSSLSSRTSAIEQEENLLKEWSIDFTRLQNAGATSGSPARNPTLPPSCPNTHGSTLIGVPMATGQLIAGQPLLDNFSPHLTATNNRLQPNLHNSFSVYCGSSVSPTCGTGLSSTPKFNPAECTVPPNKDGMSNVYHGLAQQLPLSNQNTQSKPNAFSTSPKLNNQLPNSLASDAALDHFKNPELRTNGAGAGRTNLLHTNNLLGDLDSTNKQSELKWQKFD